MRFKTGCLSLGLLAASAMSAQEGQFLGSVPSGVVSPAPLTLTLADALNRALKANLGLLVSDSASDQARGQRLQALSALLPQLDARAGETDQQISRVTLGLTLPIPGLPSILGPFHYTDVRAFGSWSVFDRSALKSYRASAENGTAARLSAMDARDLVVQATANAYLRIVADASQVKAIQSQLETAQALYSRTRDQMNAGTAAAIDVLRSQVEVRQQQQRLLTEQNQFEEDKLALGRVIGLPDGQDFSVTEASTFVPLTSMTLDQALRTAIQQRPDYKSSLARVRAAEDAVQAAQAERLPTAGVTADYGDVGTTLAESHGTFSVVASAKINMFDGRRIEGDILQAQAALKQRQDEAADMSAQILYQVRAAFLNIRTAAEQVGVAQDNLNLANQTLVQSRDRFAAGVTDNIEVVQAQETVANANDTLIRALYAHNIAKVALARALGGAEQGIQTLLK